MSKEKMLEHDIDMIKKLFHFLLVSIFGVGAYAFIHARDFSLVEGILVFIVTIALIIGEFFAIKTYLKVRKEIEKL